MENVLKIENENQLPQKGESLTPAKNEQQNIEEIHKKIREVLMKLTVEVIEKVNKLIHTLKEREDARFSPLVQPAYIQTLTGACVNLRNIIIEQKNSNLEDMKEAYFKLESAFQKISEPAPRSNFVNDNRENLGKVSYHLKGVSDIVRNLALQVGVTDLSKNKEETKMLSTLLRKTADLIDQKTISVLRKKTLL